MKYLKIFDAFRVYNQIVEPEMDDTINTIRDRLIQLEDGGWNIDVQFSESQTTLQVRIESTKGRFLIREVLNEITPLILHLNAEWSLSVQLKFDSKWNPMVKRIGVTLIDQLGYLSSTGVRGIILEFHKRKTRV